MQGVHARFVPRHLQTGEILTDLLSPSGQADMRNCTLLVKQSGKGYIFFNQHLLSKEGLARYRDSKICKYFSGCNPLNKPFNPLQCHEREQPLCGVSFVSRIPVQGP